MDAHHEDRRDEPPVITSQLAYFFVPLPDVLGLPERFVFTALEPTPLELIRDEGLPPVCVGASLCFHRVEWPTAQNDELTALFDLAAKTLPRPADEGTSASRSGGSTGKAGVPAPRTRTTTVVEMAVAVELTHDQSLSEEESHAAFIDELTEAFDRGLGYVREFQRAHYLMRRKATHLVTRESLPFAVPFGIRQLFDDDGRPMPFEVPLSIYLLNMNIPGADAGSWGDGDSDLLNTAIAHQADDGPFASYMDLVRESEVALERDGAYRSAVMFTATASEVLFDDLLAHMMWEEGTRPEDGARAFDSLLTARVKSHFHGRLGGSWNVDGTGPIAEWFRQVARLRSRVVHGGYEPTRDEAAAAVDATAALTEHLGDLVAARASAYPRTSLVLPGEPGLIRRGKWSRALDDLRKDPSEVKWRQTFARWRFAMQRARKDSPVFEAPSTSDAIVSVVIRTDGSEQWVVHDPQAGMAAPLDPAEVTDMSPEQVASGISQVKEHLAGQAERSDEAVLLHNAKVGAIPSDRWLPEYRLIPQAGVMVNGQNLDDPPPANESTAL